MVTVRIPTIGMISLYIHTLIYSDGFFYIQGHDEFNNNYLIKSDYISWQDDYSYEYGWMRIVEYCANGISVQCRHVSSMA